MPRGSRSRSRSSSGSRFTSGPTRSSFTSSRPMNTPTTGPTTSSSPGMTSTLGGALMTGMAFGAGSQVAHNVIRGITGSGGHTYVQNQQTQPIPGKTITQPKVQNNPCFNPMEQLSNCIKKNQDNISACQSFFDRLKDCRIANHL